MELPTVAILAGGLATRLYPMTKDLPKALISINGTPFIDLQLSALAGAGFKKVVLCLGYLGREVMDHVEDGSKYGMNVDYSFDGDRQLGTGGALLSALDKLDSNFFVLYGDSYLLCDYGDMYLKFLESSGSGLMSVFRNKNRLDKSNTKICGDHVVAYDKETQDSDFEYIDYGASILTRDSFSFASNLYESFDLTEVFKNLIKGKSLYAYEVGNRFYEVGSYQGISDFKEYIKEQTNGIR